MLGMNLIHEADWMFTEKTARYGFSRAAGSQTKGITDWLKAAAARRVGASLRDLKLCQQPVTKRRDERL